MNKVQRISRIILQPVKNFTLKINVKLYQEKNNKIESYHKEFEFNKIKYLTLNPSAYLSLDINNKEEEWDKSKSIMITQRNIYQLIKNFKIMLDNMYKDDIFAMNSKGEIIIYSDMVNKYIIKIYNLGLNQRMIIKPAIVYDENEVSYEGIIMYINNSDNFVELPIDAFESLFYTLSKIDIHTYSQQLLNYYVSCLDKEEDLNNISIVNKKYHPISDVNNKEKEEVKGFVFRPKSDKEIFNFN